MSDASLRLLRLPASQAMRWLLPVFVIILASAIATPAQADTICPRASALATLHLPRLRAALATGVEAVIVALGSSSTEGVAASSPARAYPAMLQAELSHIFPTSHVAVVNRGIGGQDAAEEAARLDADVIAIRPQLVVWQVGANGAMRRADPVEFQRQVSAGVARLTKANIDVILMDNQRAPRILASPSHAALENALSEVAAATSVNLFSRGSLMDSWASQGAAPDQFIAADGLHHNDYGYGCVAKALARQIASAVGAPVSVSASR